MLFALAWRALCNRTWLPLQCSWELTSQRCAQCLGSRGRTSCFLVRSSCRDSIREGKGCSSIPHGSDGDYQREDHLVTSTDRVAWEGRRTPAAKAGKECQSVRGCLRTHMWPLHTEMHTLVQGYCKMAGPSSLHTEFYTESKKCSQEKCQLFHHLLGIEGCSRKIFPGRLFPLSSPQFWPQRIRNWLASGGLH